MGLTCIQKMQTLGKQCRPWSDFSLICVYTVQTCMSRSAEPLRYTRIFFLKYVTAGLSKNIGLFQYIGERDFLLFNLKVVTADTCDILEFPLTTHQVLKLYIFEDSVLKCSLLNNIWAASWQNQHMILMKFHIIYETSNLFKHKRRKIYYILYIE